MATNSGEPSLEWHFSQVFGERTPGEELLEADIISTVEFDQSGDYLATGDRGGRVVLFERLGVPKPSGALSPDERTPTPPLNPFEYRYLTEFQSHEPEFDYLKSLEIEEKINKIRWLPQWRGTGSHMLLTTNDKTIKLWKVYERQLISLSDFNLSNAHSGGGGGGGLAPFTQLNSNLSHMNNNNSFGSPDKASIAAAAKNGANSRLRFPKVIGKEGILSTKCRRIYGGAHTYHINSLSISSDQETFMSADDLRINLWHMDRPNLSFNIVDIKPTSMEDLTEVITCAEFHPSQCHTLAYSSSKGCIRIADMREAALCDQHSKIFEGPEPHSTKSFFAEIITSINDIKFLSDGRHLLARDYMTLKLWDLNMEREPVAEMLVHEPIRNKLCDMYENDCIFDKFDCCASGSGKHYATGTYSNFFKVLSPPSSSSSAATASTTSSSTDQLLEVSRDPARRRISAIPAGQGGGSGSGYKSAGGRFGGFGKSSSGNNSKAVGGGGSNVRDEAILNDFTSKIQHMAWHPQSNVVATAASNALYLFYGRDMSKVPKL